MGQNQTTYIAEKFLAEYRFTPVEKRLAFDVWADRMGYGPEDKRCLWREVKHLSRRLAA